MLFHYTDPSAVHPGDHLYVWRGMRMVEGIAVRRTGDDPSKIDIVTPNGVNSFQLITCVTFQRGRRLRRVVYEDTSLLHWIKISGTSFTEARRPADEVVQNALLLLDESARDPQGIEKVIMDNFARFCSTAGHEKWRSMLVGNVDQNIPSVNHVAQRPGVPTSEEQTRELASQIEKLEEKQCCFICMDRNNDVAFSCGHLACAQCADQLTECPKCRRNINQRISLYW